MEYTGDIQLMTFGLTGSQRSSLAHYFCGKIFDEDEYTENLVTTSYSSVVKQHSALNCNFSV